VHPERSHGHRYPTAAAALKASVDLDLRQNLVGAKEKFIAAVNFLDADTATGDVIDAGVLPLEK
jgi:hypothetical protein